MPTSMTAPALGLSPHATPPSGPLPVRVSTQILPNGLTHLQVCRGEQPVLTASTRPVEEGHQLVAAHRFTALTAEELDVSREALVRLVSPEAADLALSRLSLAPRRAGFTPWGEVLSFGAVQPGVYHVLTRRHSGYWVDAEVRASLPLPAQLAGGWYEQDVQGAILAAFLGWCPQNPDLQQAIRTVLRRHHPELLELLGEDA